MSISTDSSRVAYVGNGATKDFAFKFKVWDGKQIRVLEAAADGTESDITAKVTVKLSASGGTVTLGKALEKGHRLVILRSMPFIQEDRYITGTRFDPHELEDALDVACAERQELREKLERAVTMPATSEQTPAEYQASYFAALEALKADTTGAVNSLVSSGVAQITKKQQAAEASATTAESFATAASVSQQAAEAALRQVQNTVRTSIAQAVQKCLAAAENTSADRAAINDLVQEASEQAAADIIAKCTGAAELCLQYATSAAASSCSASMTRDNIWAIIREYTIDAAEEAAQCVLAQCKTAAETSTDNAMATASLAAAAASSASTAQSVVNVAAQETVDKLVKEFTDCMETVCVDSVDMCLEYSKTAAANASAAAASADFTHAVVKEYAEKAASEAAKAAALETTKVCREICADCIELAATHAYAAAGSATAAAGSAEIALQTDICKEMNARRAADDFLAERIDALETMLAALKDRLPKEE